MQSRLRFVDIAKGIGMICIILGHLGRPEINQVVFTFHVPLFFLIAGYFFRPAKLGIGGIEKRAARLIVPYVFCAVACCLGKGVLACLKGDPQGSWSAVAVSFARAVYGSGTLTSPILGIKQFGAIWFLLALFWALCIYDGLCGRKYTTIAVVCCFAVGYLTKGFWLPLSFQAGLCGVLFIHIGAIFRSYIGALKSRISTKTFSFALAACVVIWTIVFVIDHGRLYLVRNYYENIPLDVIGAVAGSLIVLVASFVVDKIPAVSNVLGAFGKYSLTALCFHMFDLVVIPWTDLLKIMGLNVPVASSWKTCLVLAGLKLAWASLGVCAVVALNHLKSASETMRPLLSAPSPSSERIRSIDIAKGIAIILVIAGHQYSVDPFFRKMVFSFHMPLFFLLNGSCA